MDRIISLFWNRRELRLRAAYRITLFLVIVILSEKLIRQIYGSMNLGVGFRSNAPLWVFLLIGLQILVSGLLSTWLMVRFVDRRQFSNLGFNLSRQWWLDLGLGLLLGFFLISVIFLIGYLCGWIEVDALWFTNRPETGVLLPIMVFFLVTLCFGITEEVISRGYLLRNMSEGLNLDRFDARWAVLGGWLLSSAFFGAFHLDNDNATALSTLNITLGGIFLGLAYVLTGQLAIPVGIHITWNFSLAIIYGFPVSGIDVPGKVVAVIKTHSVANDLWDGGVFGPEGGLLGSVAIVLGFVLVFLCIRLRSKSKLELLRDLAKPPPTASKTKEEETLRS